MFSHSSSNEIKQSKYGVNQGHLNTSKVKFRTKASSQNSTRQIYRKAKGQSINNNIPHISIKVTWHDIYPFSTFNIC